MTLVYSMSSGSFPKTPFVLRGPQGLPQTVPTSEALSTPDCECRLPSLPAPLGPKFTDTCSPGAKETAGWLGVGTQIQSRASPGAPGA